MKRKFIKIWDNQTRTTINPTLLFISACFIIGVIAGSVVATNVADPDQMGTIIQEFASGSFNGLGSCIVKFMKYPAIIFLCGVSIFGFVLIPVTVTVRAFFLSYAITSIINAYGSAGMAYALSLFGIQCLVTLPCIFLLASQGLVSASLLFSLATGSGKKVSTGIFNGAYFIRVLICIIVLLLGSLLEWLVTPLLSYI